MKELPITLPDAVTAEKLGAGTWLWSGVGKQGFSQASWGPLKLPGLSRYVAFCLTSHFVTSPFFGRDLREIPARCQFLLWEEMDGVFGALIPLLDSDFRAEARGCEGGLEVTCECGPVGLPARLVALAMISRAGDPYSAVNLAVKEAVAWMKRGNLREEKKMPRWMDYLGWCTWDAFYTKVDEAKILDGLRAFQAGGVVPGQIIIDEGWQDATETKYLKSYGLKPGAFSGDSLQSLIHQAKSEFGVKMVGCWRTLFGQLRGVNVDSDGLAPLRRRLVHEKDTDHDTFGVVEPPDVKQFHETYAARLSADGVDFLKVDFQSALHLMTYEQLGRADAARLWQHSLQQSVNKHFQGEILNCMAMGSAEVFHTWSSNVGRSSDDFFPTRDDSHPAHIRQNLYNAVWFSPFQWPDWDMFQSLHPWAMYHAVGRAISGGPVYVSDKPGQSDYALLQRFVAADGKLLRCPQPALPTRDMIFNDPSPNAKLLKAQNRCGETGLLAVFHPDSDPASPPIEEEVSAMCVEGMSDTPYAVYSIKEGFLGVKKSVCAHISWREADLLIFSPISSGFAPLGLLDKMNPAAAILCTNLVDGGLCLSVRGGGRFGICCLEDVSAVQLNGRAIPFKQENRLVTFETGDEPLCEITIRLKL